MSKCTLFLTALFFAAQQLSAQCPVVLNCSAPTDTICDFSLNDNLLWASAFWWDPANGIHDLAEAPTDLNLLVLDTCGGVVLRFLLFLDLDGNGSLETVLNSDSLPPAATIYFDNAGNPGYSGGTPLVFDERPVIAADKFHFTLQQTFNGDTLLAKVRWTTASNPSIFVDPELPLGKHKIVWFIGNAGTTDTCTRHFIIRDCEAPDITCHTGLSVNIQSGGYITMWAVDFLKSATDNITPEDLLQFAIRKSGDGIGFPLDALDNPITSVTFECCSLGPHMVDLWVRDNDGNSSFCSTYIDIQEPDGICGQCGETINACVKTFSDSTKIHDVIFNLKILPSIALFENSLTKGCVDFPSLLHYGYSYTLKAEKDDNPLNGVSTFDLVLISKHILGLESLDAPWKMLAADANRSNSITTFDIVELRKLILGVYTELPDNTSWRFVQDDYVFPDPGNPFASPIPDSVYVSNFAGNGPAEHTFYGYKVGDVNNTSIPSDFIPASDDRAVTCITLPDLIFQAGETIEISVKAGEAGKWNGLQLGLQFDPAMIEIEQVISGVLPGLDENAWAKPRPGLLNLSWFDAIPQTVLPGDGLFNLRIRALASGRLSEAITLSAEHLHPEFYAANNTVHSLQLRFSEPIASGELTAIYPPQPNPTSLGASFPIRLAEPETLRVEVMDASGRIIFQQGWLLESGNQMLDIPASVFQMSGVYVWRVQVGEVVQVGKIVKTD